MDHVRLLRAAACAVPGIALAVAGSFHPQHLNYGTSARWTVLHVAGVLAFPLLGLALASLVRRRRDPVAVVVVVAAYVYATAYTALDVISGIAAGFVTHRIGPGVPRPDEVRYLFEIGGRVGEYGSWAFLLGAVLVALDRVWRLRLRALVPAVLLVLAAYSFMTSHIFPWRGVVTVLVIGLATGWLAFLGSREPRPG